MAGKIRVHELSKALGIPSKAIVEECQKRGMDVKNHMSVLDEVTLGALSEVYPKDAISALLAAPVAEPEGEKASVPRRPVRKKGVPKVVMAKADGKAEEDGTAAGDAEKEIVILQNDQVGAVKVEQTRVSSTIIRRRRQTPGQEGAEPVGGSEQSGAERTAEGEAAQGETGGVAAEGTQAVAGVKPRQALKVVPPGGEIPAEKEEDKGERGRGKVDEKGERFPTQPADYKESKRAAGYKKVRKAKDEQFDPRQYLRVTEEEDIYRPTRNKKKVVAVREPKKTLITTPKASKRVIRIEKTITVGELAHRLQVKSQEVIKKLMALGMMATINQELDFETVSLVAAEYKYEVQDVSVGYQDVVTIDRKGTLENQQPRPPVVTIMGHVDHGKTTLLDAIRKTNVAEQEFGGITQHIGAYSVDVGGKRICFVDTPGHEAFTAMRSRGAQVTDIIVLVVAAEEGVKPQTKEAIAHAQAAKVPIVVAVNKIDKPEANPQMVKQALSGLGLVAEEWGGETIFVPVSAKQNKGIQDLLEHILVQAEVMDLKADATCRGVGVIIESRLDKGAGPICTVIVKEGTLHDGDVVVSGAYFGRVRAMFDHQKKPLKEAPPSTPVEVMGLDGVPDAGEKIYVMENEEKAREAATLARAQGEKEGGQGLAKVSLEDLYAKIKEGNVESLNIVLKTDVQGSLEALEGALKKVESAEVKVEVVYAGVGAITDSDVQLAVTSNGVVLGFNVRPVPSAKRLAEQEKISIKTYTIIYELLDDVQKAMLGLLKPEYEEVFLGRAEVRNVFKISQVGTIAGCFVVDGKIHRSGVARLLRDHVQVHQGKITSLKRFKDDAREVGTGFECGIGFEGFQDIKVGDVIESYEMRAITPTLTAKAGQ